MNNLNIKLLHRHLEAGEGNHLRAERDVNVVERGSVERLLRGLRHPVVAPRSRVSRNMPAGGEGV